MTATARRIRLGAALLALAVFTLVGCASSPIVGTVVAKDHRPGYYSTQIVCMAYKDGICTSQTPIMQWHPDQWRLDVEVKGEKLADPTKVRTAYVNKDYWDTVEVGDHFDDTPEEDRP